MKGTKILSFLFILVLLFACSEEKELKESMPFEKYDFIREEFKSSDTGYLLGNAEMGGIADINGLGFEKLWFTDLWENDRARKFIPLFSFSSKELKKHNLENSKFNNRYTLKDGIYETNVIFDDGFGYSSKMFFSLEEKHRLVFNLKNTSNSEITWNISLPIKEYQIERSENIIIGTTEDNNAYTNVCWSMNTSRNISNENEVKLSPEEDITIIFSITTHFDGPKFKEDAVNIVKNMMTFEELEKNHSLEWDQHWNSIGSIILPDGHYAKWFYRAIRGIYNTTGAEHFLAAEKQFAVPDVDWQMHSFTYGHGGGWPIWVFAQLGDYERAKNMISSTYKPEALNENVKILFPEGPVNLKYRGKEKGSHTYIDKYNPNAIAFGHEVTTDGYNITYSSDKHWDWQRHVDAYAASFFHLVDRLYPDPKFTEKYTYPVLKGTAELWSSLVKWDEERNIYFLPPLLSVSENIMEKSVLDAVLAAKWNLKMAANYAQKQKVDSDLSEKWLRIYDKLYVPQNDDIFLEYLDDPQDRQGGGYFGIRAFACFGYPYLEEIKNLDPEKARRALDLAWERNGKGKGMISFISDWFALTEAYLGNGDKAYEISELTTHILNKSEEGMAEAYQYDEDGNVVGIYNPYFLTGYDALVLVPISMMLHSYDGTIEVFPAMPKEWSNASFYDLQAEEGVKVSAKMKNGKFLWASYKIEGEEVLKLYEKKKVTIQKEGAKIILKY